MFSRITFSIVPALFLVFGIFWTLETMIRVGATPVRLEENLHMVDFIRLKKETPIQKKERVKPKKPKPVKKPMKPKIAIKKKVDMVNQPLLTEPLSIDLPINLSATSALGDALVSGFSDRAISTNVIPLSRINPVYPKRAKVMKKEGYVKLEFTITPFGSVKDVEVVASEPPDLFDTCAANALLKWKFKPKVVNNRPVEQRAIIQIDFKLNNYSS